MSWHRPGRLPVAGVLVWAAAGAYAGAFVGVALATLVYPFPLEWMEGGTVDVVQRVSAGKPVYAKPSLDYVAHIYTPLYYYASAAVASVTGVGFFAPRLVSFVSTLGLAAVIALFVRGEGGNGTQTAAGAGLFLATFGVADSWFHLARVDSFALFLLLAAFYGHRFARTPATLLATGAVAAAAVLAKQIALIALAPVWVVTLVQKPRHALWVSGAFVGALGTSAAVLAVRSGGWFTYFVWTLPLLHETSSGNFTRIVAHGLPRVAIALGAAGLALAVMSHRDGRAAAFHGALLGGMATSSLVGALHSGAYLNVLLPLYAGMAVLAPLAFPSGPSFPSRTWMSRHRAPLLTLAVAGQAALLVYRPSHAIPNASDRRAGEEFLTTLRHIDGEVLVPQQRFVPTRAGKRAYGLGMAAEDVLRVSYPNGGTGALRYELATTVRDQRFAAIILSEPTPPPVVARYYRLHGALFDGDRYVPVAGAPTRPSYVFVPAEHAAAPPE